MNMDLLEIQNPIAKDAPLGSDISHSIDFEWLDTELMKVGSLAHESIEWDKIEKLSWKILTSESKDYRVLSFLIQALLQKNDLESFERSIELLKLFLEKNWLAYPYQTEGTRIDRNRQRFLTQILKRIAQKQEEAFVVITKDQQDALIKHLQDINRHLKKKSVTLEEIDPLINSIEQVGVNHDIESRDITLQSSTTSSALSSTQKAGYSSFIQFLNAEKDRSFANRLIEQLEENEEFLLAAMMRRMQLWDDIKEIPIHSNNGETTLSSPSQEIISRANLLLNNDNVLFDEWLQLEQSLTRAPFWLDAHRISALIASKLFSLSFEIEIKKRLNDFLEKLPQLKTLTFSNGTPFITETTLHWLQEDVVSTIQDGDLSAAIDADTQKDFYQLNLWNNYLLQADEFYEKSGFTQALHYLHEQILQAQNLREKVLWELFISQIYRREGLDELANHNNQIIVTQIADTHLNEWEPQIFELLHSSIVTE